jgi:hypothetical protein
LTSSFQPPSAGGSTVPMLVVITCICVALAAVLGLAPALVGGAVALGISIFIICFVSTEASLYVLIFSMLLSPEFGMGALAGPSSTTGGRGVTIRTEDLLLVVMCFAWLTRMAVHKELGLVRATALNRPIAWYTFACLLATGMGLIFGYVNGMTGIFFVLKYVEYFVIYFIMANNIHDRDQVRRFTIAMLVTMFIVSVVAMAQVPLGGRVSAPFEGDHGEPNTLGGYLLFTGAVAGGLLLTIQERRVRGYLTVLLVFAIVPFLMTLSRGSYLGLPFVYLALTGLKRGNKFPMIAAMFLITAFGVAAMPQTVKDRITYTFNQGATSHYQAKIGDVTLDSSTSARIQSWQEAITDVAASPIWGYGVTGYTFLDAQYPRTLAETGMIGVFTFGWLILALYRQGFHLYRSTVDPLYRGLSMGLIAGLTGLLVHAVGANTFIIVRIMEPFWLTAGLVVSAARLDEERVREAPDA